MSPVLSYAFAIIVLIGIGPAQSQLDNHGIYKIVNKGDSGVLTIASGDSDNPRITLKSWKDDAGQKWKAKQPLLAKSYEFKPTSNEKFALNADAGSTKIVGKTSSSVSGNTKYWKISPMGEGVYQIKNYEFKTCLASQGLDSEVQLHACDNSKATQWQFVEL